MENNTTNIVIEIAFKTKVLAIESNNFIEHVLESFDPSLLQNVVLAILAIFIPYGIVFLTASFQNNENTNEFSRLVINDEVFSLKRLFVVAVASIIFLSFFSGTEIASWKKIVALLATSYALFLLQGSFWKMVRYSEDSRSLDMDLLKRLTFSKRDGQKNAKVIKAWRSFWSEITERNEYEFTDLFTKKIDDGIEKRLYKESVTLMDTYMDDTKSKNTFSLGQTILPKVLDWNEELINIEQKRLYDSRKGRDYTLYKDFWDWHYFQNKALIKITSILITQSNAFFLFDTFTKHIDTKYEIAVAEINEEAKERKLEYISGLIANFCVGLFMGALESETRNRDWKNNFPEKWKVRGGNAHQLISRLFADNFIQQLRDKYLYTEKQIYSGEMSDVVMALFPDADNTLFPAFLKLLDHDPVTAITLNVNFYTYSGFSYSGSGDGPSHEEISRMAEAQREAKRESVINVIYTYFNAWRHLKIYEDDLTEEQFNTWESMNKDARLVLIRETREIKLKKLLIELKSEKVNQKAGEDNRYQKSRNDMVELVTQLISFNSKYTE